MSIGQLKTNQGFIYVVYDKNNKPLDFFGNVNDAILYVNNNLSKVV